MFLVICGEDIISSRQNYLALRQEYLTKGYELVDIESSQIENIASWMSQTQSLFQTKKVFFTSSVNKRIRKNDKKMLSIIKSLSSDKSVIVVDWENVSQRLLKIAKLTIVRESKPSRSLFSLLDACFPANLNQFITILHSLNDGENSPLINIMLSRHLRNLILVKSGLIPTTLVRWQYTKLVSQARWWKLTSLVAFYENLFKIEVAIKSGSTPYSFLQSLEIVACHFL